jgi:transcriptional regulator with XRE-family HTH domain
MSYETFEVLCKQKGVKPADVSKATGVATATLTNWKKGTYKPKYEKLQKIADYFGVSVEYLSTGKDGKNETYYVNPATSQMAQELFDNPDLKMLFDAAKDSKPEDLKMAADMLRRFKETNPNG